MEQETIREMKKVIATLTTKLTEANKQIEWDNTLVKNLETQLTEARADLAQAVEDIRRYPGITPCTYCKNYGGEKRSEKCTFEGRSCFEYRGRKSNER